MKLIVPFVFFVLFFSNSCKKNRSQPPPDNPYGLPNATQTGANMFACRINGINWVLKKVNSYNLGTSFLRSNSRDTLGFFSAGNPDSLAALIRFTINDKIQQGATYHFNDTTKAIAGLLRLFARCGPISGYGGSQWGKATEGTVTFSRFSGTYTVPACCTYGTYEPASIIAGTFNLIFVIPGCDTIRVTDGRFDINYSRY